jgi:membrane protease YdiL (CAAX protease family)/Fe-S-cluster-containing hydrogenase component 2
VSRASSQLALSPERCDQCGTCVRACSKGAIRVGKGFIHVDSSACDGCMACVQTCSRRAIERRTIPTRPHAASSALTPGDVPKVVVGSRAEAKAVRAAAATALKEREAAAKSATKSAEKARTQATVAAKAPVAATGGVVHWSIVDAAWALGLLFVLVVAKEAVLSSRAMSVMPPAGQIAGRAVVLVLFYAILAAGLAVLANRHGSRLLRAFGLVGAERSSAGDTVVSAVLVVLLLFATRLFSTGWGALAQLVGWAPPGSGELTAVFGMGGFGLLLSVAVVVVAAPLIEELVFRGIVLRASLDRLDVWPAIALSAALFALSHATAWTFVPTLVLGLSAGWLTTRRGSLWPAIALHGLYNGVVVAVAYWLAR